MTLKDHTDDLDYRLGDIFAEALTAPDNANEDDISPIYSELASISEQYTGSDKIAEGGMKDIFRVYNNKTGRYVAMAKLHAGTPKELYEPFLREARLTALLEHPNIMPVYDIGTDSDNSPYFTMELKTGNNLMEIITQITEGNAKYVSAYPQEKLLQIFIKICDAISYAHSRNVIHLDIKPDNIQVGAFGEVQVCDWGLGKIIGTDENEGLEFDELLLNPDLLNNMTLNGQIKGTPGYMAPEQIKENGVKDTRTDIYSLGCLLYSFLTLKRPISGATEMVLDKTIAGDIISPQERCPEKSIPDSLNAIVVKATQLDQSQRYSTVNELKNDIQKYLSGYATEAENAGLIKQLTLLYSRNRHFFLTLAAAITAICLLTIMFIIQLTSSKNRAEKALADLQQSQNEVQKKKEELDKTIKESVTTSIKERDLKGALSKLERALNNDPNNYDLRMRYANMLFSSHKFIEASKNYKLAKHSGMISDLAHKMAAIAKERAITAEDLRMIFNELKNYHPFKERLLQQDGLKYPTTKHHADAVKYYLMYLNPGWDGEGFKYNADRRILKITGKNFSRFNKGEQSGDTLAGLKLTTLEINNTGVTSLQNIQKLPISQQFSVNRSSPRKKRFPKKFFALFFI